MSEHELVIRNGLVVDGTGVAPRRGDVAVDGGVITEEHIVSAMRREYAKASLPFPGVPPRRRHEQAR